MAKNFLQKTVNNVSVLAISIGMVASSSWAMEMFDTDPQTSGTGKLANYQVKDVDAKKEFLDRVYDEAQSYNNSNFNTPYKSLYEEILSDILFIVPRLELEKLSRTNYPEFQKKMSEIFVMYISRVWRNNGLLY